MTLEFRKAVKLSCTLSSIVILIFAASCSSKKAEPAKSAPAEQSAPAVQAASSATVNQTTQPDDAWIRSFATDTSKAAFSQDSRFIELAKRIIPKNSYSSAMELLSVPAQKVTIVNNRYAYTSGYKQHSAQEKLFFWYDLQTHKGAFAEAVASDKPIEYLVLTNDYAKNELPEDFEFTFQDWAKANGVKVGAGYSCVPRDNKPVPPPCSAEGVVACLADTALYGAAPGKVGAIAAVVLDPAKKSDSLAVPAKDISCQLITSMTARLEKGTLKEIVCTVAVPYAQMDSACIRHFESNGQPLSAGTVNYKQWFLGKNYYLMNKPLSGGTTVQLRVYMSKDYD
jgi:hypothetical protein